MRFLSFLCLFHFSMGASATATAAVSLFSPTSNLDLILSLPLSTTTQLRPAGPLHTRNGVGPPCNRSAFPGLWDPGKDAACPLP